MVPSAADRRVPVRANTRFTCVDERARVAHQQHNVRHGDFVGWLTAVTRHIIIPNVCFVVYKRNKAAIRREVDIIFLLGFTARVRSQPASRPHTCIRTALAAQRAAARPATPHRLHW